TLHAQIAAQKTVETEALGRRERARALHKQGGIAKEELDAMEAAWQKAKADLAVLEAQMRYLVGQPGKRTSKERGSDGVLLWDLADDGWDRYVPDAALRIPDTGVRIPKIEPKLGEKLRTIMAKPVSGSFTDTPAHDIVDWLADHAKGVNVHLNTTIKEDAASVKFNSPIPLSAAFQWLEDRFGWRCVIRDYGIVIIERDRIPPGALLLQDFLRTPKPE